MGSKILDDDMQELLKNMDIEELPEFATALGDEQGSGTILYSVYQEIFHRTRADKDLNHAIEVAEQVLSTISADSQIRSQIAEETSCLLGTRFESTLSEIDLDRAIFWIQETVRITPESSVHFVPRMNALADLLDTQERYMHALEQRNDPSRIDIWSNLDKVIVAPRSEGMSPLVEQNRRHI